MAENLTDKLVKFAFGKKASYSAASHSNYVYFATDYPYVHANGMWRGVSGVSLSGNTLTITTAERDSDNSNTVNTTVSVDLSSIATTSTQRTNWDTAYNFVKSITGTDTDGVINKWQEIVDFLAGIKGTTLQGIMETKANAATKVFGFNKIKVTKTNDSGIVESGDVTLGSSFQISIDHQCKTGANTYLKVTVDDTGFVNSGVTSLVESDLPAISIGKITNLQTILDGKASQDNMISVNAPLSITGGGEIGNDPVISLNYDGTTLVLGSDNKLKVGTISASQVTGLSNGYVPNTRQVKAGNGLTGGGALSADVTLSVKAYGNTISVTQNGISVLSAPKLSTARSLWGNSFDGSGSVSGDLKFVADGPTTQKSHGMRLSGASGFIGFSNILGSVVDGVKAFAGITLGWGATPETEGNSVRISDDTFTYKGHPIYYKGLAQFTTDVNSLISTALAPMATDFTALTNRVTAVENQLKWIEVTN